MVFVIHALSVPPTNGALLFDPTLTPAGYTANPVTSGAGEVLALVALGAGERRGGAGVHGGLSGLRRVERGGVGARLS